MHDVHVKLLVHRALPHLRWERSASQLYCGHRGTCSTCPDLNSNFTPLPPSRDVKWTFSSSLPCLAPYISPFLLSSCPPFLLLSSEDLFFPPNFLNYTNDPSSLITEPSLMFILSFNIVHICILQSRGELTGDMLSAKVNAITKTATIQGSVRDDYVASESLSRV